MAKDKQPNQYTTKGICTQCGEKKPAHRLTCPTLLSPKARRQLQARRVWQFLNARRKHGRMP